MAKKTTITTEFPCTCPCCGHTSLWISYSDGCPICLSKGDITHEE